MRKFTETRLVIASHNAGKVDEIGALLAPFGVEVVSAGALGLPEPEETEDNFAGNARLKAHAAAKATGLPALSDDSGMEVDVLDGAPGVYTANWAETPEGRDFTMAMHKVHDEIAARGAAEPATGRFVCTLCLAWPDGHDEIFRGEAEGHVIWPMRGHMGHGFDPVFRPLGQDLTFAEMDPVRKNAISHRADAFAKLVAGPFAKE
ncbi:non-canonical purine NTP pyrophosphatase [Oceanicella sp. SM1341]|uniref:non-canonical purine NTP pyrophosphatase n=1 Tax=Oceanicella sp. SM1341 TaxID=1548889 RepID=UPI000E4819BD|nr:non-canonical purine NTP pyrophosphatase [Oceanicella sp. SM1341]